MKKFREWCKGLLDWKKIIIGFVMIILGVIIYLVLGLLSGINLWFFLLIIHITLSILYVWNNYPKFILIILIVLLLIQGGISYYIYSNDFSSCGSTDQKLDILKSSCDCIGFKKYSFLGAINECVGIRTHCYEYTYLVSSYNIEYSKEKQDENRVEVPCK